MEQQALRQAARAAYQQGQFVPAVQQQLALINAQMPEERNAVDFLMAALYLFHIPDATAAAGLLRHALSFFPEDARLHENLGVCLSRSGQYREALASFADAMRWGDETANVLDGMTYCYGQLGDTVQLRQCGEKVLRMKDQAVPVLAPVSRPAPPAFRPEGVNLICFSLFGDNPRYLDGAIENVEAARWLYPGWRCRFYCDESVPLAVREALQAAGGELVLKPLHRNHIEGLYWRFEVMGEPGVERFLVRDVDSVVSIRERLVVNEWLASDRHFHVMRDWFSHTDLILAGMWGGVGGLLPSLATLQAAFKPERVANRNQDQEFLGQMVWPRIRDSVLVHDRWFSNFAARPFPPGSELGGNRHVGQNAAVLRNAAKG